MTPGQVAFVTSNIAKFTAGAMGGAAFGAGSVVIPEAIASAAAGTPFNVNPAEAVGMALFWGGPVLDSSWGR